MENIKYELTTEVNEFNGEQLFRIKAVKSFGNVTRGDLGGFVSAERNLGHSGDAWVYNNAKVYGNAKVCDNALVAGNARVSGDACVAGNAQVFGDAKVCGDVWVFGNAWVYGDARVSGDARVCGDALVIIKLPVYQGSTHTCNPIPCKNELLIRIGCQIHTYEKWIQCGEAIAKADNMTLLQRTEYLGYVEMCKFWYDNYCKKEA